MAVMNSSNYIISGGLDCLLSVWNQFSGVLKYAVKMPDPLAGGNEPESASESASDDGEAFRRQKRAST